MNKQAILKFLYCGLVAVTMIGLPACSVEKTQSAKAPDVDIDVDPGRWPGYNVKWADVDVGTTQRTVTVPKVQITREQEQISVPYIDINPPGARDVEERTVSVGVDVPNPGYDLRIREIRASGDTLWVVSELTKTGETSGDPMRLSDRVVIKAPEDLDVRNVIIGDRPDGVNNQQYTFMNNRSDLDRRIPQGSRVIYQRSA